MDAVEFFKEKERLCDSYVGCSMCPLSRYDCYFGSDSEETVAVVEQWSEEHPKMTNADKLVKAFGKIRFDDITPDWLKQEYNEPEEKNEQT